MQDHKTDKKDLNLGFFIKIFLVYLCIAATLLLALIVFFRSVNWVDLTPESITEISESLRIYDTEDELISTVSGNENRIFISIEDIPKQVQLAFVAAEDVRFFDHNGVDIKRIFGAVVADIKAGYYKEGGSTITQQLIKNSHLSGTKKISRKLQEALLACQLESRYSKEQILEMYLNYIYFGNGAYGIEAAAQTYFGKSAKDISLGQAAMLAGVIKAPSKYAPNTQPDNAIFRRNTILELMQRYEFISQQECTQAKAEKLVVSPNPILYYSYGYFLDEVLQDASKKTGLTLDQLLNGGYSIKTTLNPALAAKVEEVLADPEVFPTSAEDQRIESAVVVLDSKTGAVLAMSGGREYQTRMGFNRATMAQRSPGSTIKPLLVYAPAIDTRMITAATVLDDTKKSFGDYAPNNYNDRYYGNVTVRDALVKSLNIPAVEIFQNLGVETGKKYGTQLGIAFDEQDVSLTLALGGFTRGISPLRLASGYQCLANQGSQSDVHYITSIADNTGKTIYSFMPTQKQVFSSETAYIVSDILHDAANKYGSPFRNMKNLKLSAKTGTASYSNNGNSDIWVAAYNADYTMTVWEGYDITDKNHYLPSNATGSKYPSVIAARLFDWLYTDTETPVITPIPSGIVLAALDKEALLGGNLSLATSLTPQDSRLEEFFLQGTQPMQYSEYYSAPEQCTLLVDLINGQPRIKLITNNEFTYYRVYRLQNNIHTQIGTVSGRQGETLIVNDQQAQSGIAMYYVIPEHGNLKQEDGSPLLGKASRLVSIEIPQS